MADPTDDPAQLAALTAVMRDLDPTRERVIGLRLPIINAPVGGVSDPASVAEAAKGNPDAAAPVTRWYGKNATAAEIVAGIDGTRSIRAGEAVVMPSEVEGFRAFCCDCGLAHSLSWHLAVNERNQVVLVGSVKLDAESSELARRQYEWPFIRASVRRS